MVGHMLGKRINNFHAAYEMSQLEAIWSLKLAQDVCLSGLKLCVVCNKEKVYTVVEICDTLVQKKGLEGLMLVGRKCAFSIVVFAQCQAQWW